MKLHQWFDDPSTVLVSRIPVGSAPTGEQFRRASVEALEAIGLELSNERVVIKPNVTIGEKFADPGSGITTHPMFVLGIGEYLLGHGAQKGGISILEDPRNTDDDSTRHWRGTGYPEVASQIDAVLRSPSSTTCVTKSVPHPRAAHELSVSRVATDPESILINVPKLKTHNLAITTLCLKNLMGVVHAPDRHYCRQAWLEIPEHERAPPEPADGWFDCRLHERWQEGLACRLIDTAQVVTPHLNLVEGVVGRDGTGFRNGINYPIGISIAGTNMAAVDTVASYIMGFDPASIVYLRLAGSAGLGPTTMDRIRVFVTEDRELTRCTDVSRLRVAPPFRVISRMPGAD